MTDPLPLVGALAYTKRTTPDGMLEEAHQILIDNLGAMEAGRNPRYRMLLRLVEMIEQELRLDHWKCYGY